MGEIIKFDQRDEGFNPVQMNNELNEITGNILMNARTELCNQISMSVPIAQLASLGAGVSSLLPAFRTVSQTVSINTSGLYRLANEAVGDTLKAAKNGNFWGAFKTANGASKFAQFQSVDSLTASYQTIAAINPATMMMAVTLFSIEQQLGEIEQMQKQILSFLEIEKESEIEADVETLSNIVSKYKMNWDNEHFVTGNHKMVLDIQRTARKNMLSYQKKVSDVIRGKKLVIAQAQVNTALQDLLKKFKYYRLSLYSFSMASLMEIMLSGNFKEEYIAEIKAEIETMASTYRDIFQECSSYLEQLSSASVEKNVKDGIGTASKAVGRLLGNIPMIKEGSVNEFLIDRGTHMKKNAHSMEESTIRAFSEISNPMVHVFTDQMADMIRIYNHTKEICFDEKQIYLITG